MDAKQKLILAFLLAGTAVAAAADETRWYLGATLGLSSYDGIADADPIPLNVDIGDPVFLPGPPSAFSLASIQGTPFDGSETAWSFFGGYNILPWLAVEFGYWDLGNNGSEFLNTALETEEIYAATRFRYGIADDWAANWLIGLARAEFSVDGTRTVFVTTDPDNIFFPPALIARQVDVADPGNETGLLWGFGFEWSINERFGFDVSYRKHEIRVLGIETYAGALIVRF